ncbi:hypothetical protein MIND_01220300 [Mycena indigotica]|uniref:DUF6535 domain-containing protein n=1 Tax=Mycena indigotica TaxID=2126181 RepID=A0A8H6VS39_9AGAR|nr:uncharacterized protein MIND_01220300 [Mycena indigotica]KAF7291947.1 hypothetical protein MIND_01220300 [Mycena indigotica]
MPRSEDHAFSERAEEAGAAKLWSVYVDEAERYDKSLVASWKSDMEGMLIFAGLFSASLTAFLIESYKTLVPDSGEATVQLLQQILVVSSSNSTFTPPISQPFRPSASSLVCNTLWFISLGLSLTCALVATLLEQWARDFLHRANIRSSPVVRARIYSYLYYGLRQYKMHAVVDTIPSLLHASLLFFFGGLVAFLLPVNKIIAGLVGGILGFVLGIYAFLTVFPLFRLNSPYRTSLSNTIWGICQSCVRWWRRHRHPGNYSNEAPTTIVDNIIKNAVKPSGHRKEWDTAALIWTMRSLSDDTELQTFVEAIPDAMWGPKQQHRRNVELMTTLRDSEQVNLLFRIAELWRSCDNGLLSVDAVERRDTACLKAFWALCSSPTPPPVSKHVFPSVLVHVPSYRNHQLPQSRSLWSSPFFVSMNAMANWSGLLWLRIYLAWCSSQQTGIISLDSMILRRYLFRFFLHPGEIDERYTKLARSTNNRELFDTTSNDLCDAISLRIYLGYLQHTIQLPSLPYRRQETLDTIYPRHIPRDSDAIITDNDLEELEIAINNNSPQFVPNSSRQLSTVMIELCRMWRPQETRRISAGIINYIKHHGSAPDTLLPLHTLKDSEVWKLFSRSGFYQHLWRCFPAAITLGHLKTITDNSGILRMPSPDAVIQALMSCTAPMAVVVLLVVRISLFQAEVHKRLVLRPRSRVIATSPQMPDSARSEPEAAVIIIADFLEKFTVSNEDDALRAVAALQSILDSKYKDWNIDWAVHDSHQTRFVGGLVRLVETQGPAGRFVAQRVLEGKVFDPPDGSGLDRFRWITEAVAQADFRLVQSRLAEAGPAGDESRLVKEGASG